MLIEKWKPMYAPDMESGSESAEVAETVETTPKDTPESTEGPGSGRSSIRKSLEKGFAADKKANEGLERESRGTKSASRGRVAGGAEIVETEISETAEEESDSEIVQPQTAAPEAFSKEAKSEWAKVPAAVQAAVLKRETDTAKGVEELKNRYKDIDAAIAPHVAAIRQLGHTPGQAVNQLFAWFQALGSNPDIAFPALAKSFNWDVAKLGGQAPEQQELTPSETDALPPAVQKYISDMQTEMQQIKQTFGQELTGLKSTFQQQTEAKTNEILANWSRDKPHFESVRQLMAQLIQSGAIQVKDGQVGIDALDSAYQMAVYANPEIRTKVLADQQATAEKERKAKADAAAKAATAKAAAARSASVSLGGGAPGEPSTQLGKKGKGKTVRESLMEAREELTS